MNAVSGLAERKNGHDNALNELRAAGFSAQRTRLPAQTNAVSTHLTGGVRRNAHRAAAFGAGLGGIAYAVIGVSAAQCAAHGGVPALWCAGTAVVFTLFGLGLGACGGAFLSRVEAKQAHRTGSS